MHVILSTVRMQCHIEKRKSTGSIPVTLWSLFLFTKLYRKYTTNFHISVKLQFTTYTKSWEMFTCIKQSNATCTGFHGNISHQLPLLQTYTAQQLTLVSDRITSTTSGTRCGLFLFLHMSWCSMVCLCVCLCVGHVGEPSKNGWTDQDVIWLNGGTYTWVPLVNTVVMAKKFLIKYNSWRCQLMINADIMMHLELNRMYIMFQQVFPNSCGNGTLLLDIKIDRVVMIDRLLKKCINSIG